MASYRVLARGEAVGVAFALLAGGELELLLPALALPATVRNLLEAGRAAQQTRASHGLAMDVVQAIAVAGEPAIAVATSGALLITFRAQQAFPIAVALSRDQVHGLIEDLQAALGTKPKAPRQH